MLFSLQNMYFIVNYPVIDFLDSRSFKWAQSSNQKIEEKWLNLHLKLPTGI